jgi:hypothetical protein
VPDGLVQLQIQNFVTKFDIQNLERGGCSLVGVGVVIVGLVRLTGG